MQNHCSEVYADLIERLARGEADAIGELIGLAQGRLQLRISQMLERFPAVHRLNATSDVLQEVLLDLTGTLRRLTPRNARHFLGLAGQRIRWKLLDLARRPDHSLLATQVLINDEADTTNDPVRLAQWEEIHQYIQSLPDDERELFDLIFYQGVPQTLVARLLGMPYRTLKARWQEVRLRFMERFEAGPF